jgi:hypothetical protein
MSMRPNTLIKRSHRVSLYAPDETPAGYDDWGHSLGGGFEAVPIATDVECNLQPLTGSVEQSVAGREIDAQWQGALPGATTVREDMGVVVTAVSDDGVTWGAVPVSHPTKFRVRQVGWKGNGWDTEVMLGVTQEAIA